MVNYQWSFVAKTENAIIYVDYKRRRTKIIGTRYVYIYDGVYPYHNPDYSKKYKL